MSIPTATAARIYKGQKAGKSGEEGLLSFEEFPYLSLSQVCITFHDLIIMIDSLNFYVCICQLQLIKE